MIQKRKFVFLACLLLIALFSAVVRAEEISDSYRLSKVLVLSRHNLRTPTAGGAQVLPALTPHDWAQWTAAPTPAASSGTRTVRAAN